jgi:hypothetical protein
VGKYQRAFSGLQEVSVFDGEASTLLARIAEDLRHEAGSQ